MHPPTAEPSPRRLARLVEELDEHGLDLGGSEPWHHLAVAELDYALRPHVHERRIPSYGAVVAPTHDPSTWSGATSLTIDRRPTGATPPADARAYADGVASWLIRDVPGGPDGPDGPDGTADDGAHDEWATFDRPAGSERDLVVLAEAFGGVVVQRHPSGVVRLVGPFGTYRWEGVDWHHEPPVGAWLDTVRTCVPGDDRDVFRTMLEFAVHDLGALGVGATLVYRPGDGLDARHEHRLADPPPLRLTRPSDLAPLRHALAQVDGASFFDADGALRHIGVRLVPSAEAETRVPALGGTRHTSARRYSHDDPGAVVVVVSEAGPVTVLRHGKVLGESPHEHDAD